MFTCAFFGDMLIFRMLIIFFMAMLKLCVGCCKGYKKVPYKSGKDIRGLVNNAVKDMFSHTKHYKAIDQETPGYNTENGDKKMKDKQDKALKLALMSFAGKHDNLDRHETSSK